MGSEIAPYQQKAIETWGCNDVVAFIADSVDITLPPQWRSTLGKMAKEMLAGGVDAATVNAACLIAVRRGKPHLAQYIAGDLMLARSGETMSESEYRQQLRLYAVQQNGGSPLEQQRARRLEAERERDKRRNGHEA